MSAADPESDVGDGPGGTSGEILIDRAGRILREMRSKAHGSSNKSAYAMHAVENFDLKKARKTCYY